MPIIIKATEPDPAPTGLAVACRALAVALAGNIVVVGLNVYSLFPLAPGTRIRPLGLAAATCAVALMTLMLSLAILFAALSYAPRRHRPIHWLIGSLTFIFAVTPLLAAWLVCG